MTQFSTASHMPSSICASHRRIQVLVVGPELLANALCALLSNNDDIYTYLPPLSDPDEVLPFIQRVDGSDNCIDVVVIQSSGNLESDRELIQILSLHNYRCLFVTMLIYPKEIEWLRQAGAWGYFFTGSPMRQFTYALRSIARDQKYFPDITDVHIYDTNVDLSYLNTERPLVYHPERLESLARKIGYTLSQSEKKIFAHIWEESVEDIANKIDLQPITVRRLLSEHIFEFLGLISNKKCSSRTMALRIVLQKGIWENTELPPPGA